MHGEALNTAETVELPRPERASLLEPARLLTAAAGLLLVGGLALALGEAGTTASLAAAGAGTVLALFVLVPRAIAGAQRHPMLVVGALLAAAPVLLIGFTGYVGDTRYLYGLTDLVRALLPLSIVGLAALGGLVLLAEDLRVRLGTAGLTPWQRLTGTHDTPVPAPWRALAGLTLLGGSALLLLAFAGANGGDVVVLFVLAVGAFAVIVTPLVIAGFARADRVHVEDAREDERRRVAAHLHDSVLQTLALVQRQAHDPAAVARLARRQEHELRAWMAGEVELGSETLGAALRAAVAEVEDDHGATVELTMLGDRRLDRSTEALAAAAREALRNAARHAPGAPIFVFGQANADGAEVFVRDEGPGFELETVPTERRGVRDSIVGRMAAVGGSAVVESRFGEGTEIALRIGVIG
ncbi:sensor histidine kinase [Solirubrobacter soli]|uniref:sensor histidine kinase n=1 Tax=Solirubrobacter soli TaxID=363832 RepID=UPI0004279247|nr:ATP-binding protein [Solirubrobacter soli]